MKLHVIDCGNFMIDGGALFGVIPKTMWEKVYPANEKNLCNIVMRSLLVDTGDRQILIDSGSGTKQDPSFFKYDYRNGDGELMKSLAEAGYFPEDITDVVHTHLHYDHCGGTLKKLDDGTIVSAFPNADLWVSKVHWDWATHPNKREVAAFPPENILPMQETGRLRFIENEGELFPGFEVRFANGHTRGQVIPIIDYQGKKLVYCADLVPTMANVSLLFISAFDLFQLDVIDEKEQLLNEAAEKQYTLFFEHDLIHECCTVQQGSKRVEVKKMLTLKEFQEN